MTTDTTDTHEKRPFNLSRWAIGHPSIARFLFGLIIVAVIVSIWGVPLAPVSHAGRGRMKRLTPP